MLVSDFNYDLPEEVIAQHPPKVRGTTRLLALNRQTGEVTDSHYANLDEFLQPGDSGCPTGGTYDADFAF